MFQNGKPFIFNNDEKILEQYNPFSINWKDYQTVETLGSGSDGLVVKLQDSQSQHCIAAKISQNRNNRSEVNTLLMTDHVNIIKLIGYEFTQSKRILYLKNFDGITLESLIIENNGLKISDLFPIYYQVLNAIEYLHNMNIAHMDIKPNNILINKSGKVKLIDFENSLNFSSFPYVKGAIGSYVFGAPEINLDGFYCGLPCDVFSLHLTLGIAVVGKIFWSKAHISEPNYYKWITEKEKPEELNNIDEEMFKFLKRVLVHSPTNRPTLKQIKQDSWFLEMESKFIK